MYNIYVTYIHGGVFAFLFCCFLQHIENFIQLTILTDLPDMTTIEIQDMQKQSCMRPHAHYAYIYRERTYILTLTALCCHCPFLICRNFRKCVFPVVYIAGVVVTSTPISITHIFIELCFALIQFQFPCTWPKCFHYI